MLARCNVVLEGYWEQPEATADAIVDGWFHTGDGGAIDDEGYLTISDRKKDVIISGGENVSSIEVEDASSRTRRWPRSPSSACPTRSGARRSRRSSCWRRARRRPRTSSSSTAASKLAHFKCPTSVEFRDELARTATGKLQKFKLRAPYWEGRERQVN